MTDTTCIWTSPDECVMVRERVLRLLDGSWRCPLHAPRDPLADLLLSIALASYSGLRNTLLDANAKTLDTIDSQLGKDEEGLPPTLRR